ncbi:MAG: hypothetical protein MJ164_03550 [Alphaproteobacteria bacterium]|nr:hypothetical protein [Alphaproteobacteria bacterium]
MGYKIRALHGKVSQKNLGFWYTMHKGKKLRNSKKKSKYRESKKMQKKHMFLRVFSKITIFACVFCAFFISPVFATLPAGYTELEYIESTGTQWIDTGIKVLDSDEIITRASVTGTPGSFVFSQGHYNDNQAFQVSCSSATTNAQFDIQTYTNSYRVSSNLTIKNTFRDIHIKNKEFFVDGVSFGSSIGTLTNPTENLKLFYKRSTNEAQAAQIGIFEVVGKIKLVPAKRISDSVIGMYDTVSGQFFTNQGTGSFIAGPVVEIKIATTKMVDEEFAAAEANLAATVQTIESVVSRTITQTEQIATLQAEKQTRPDETCPANMKCLLVQDEDGTPHWYPIIEP